MHVKSADEERSFYTFLVVFIATATITLLGITGLLVIPDFYLKSLTAALLIELIGAVIALYRNANFFAEENEQPNAKRYQQSRANPTSSPTLPAQALEPPQPAEETPSKLKSAETDQDPQKALTPPAPTSPLEKHKTAAAVSLKNVPGFQQHFESLKAFVKHLRDCEYERPAAEVDSKAIFKRFVGIEVDWVVTLGRIKKIDEENVEIIANEEMDMVTTLPISIDTNPQIRLIRKGSKIRLKGRLAELDVLHTVVLSNSEIELIAE